MSGNGGRVTQTFNIITNRSSPNEAKLSTGEIVEKQEFVFFMLPGELGKLKAGEWVSIKCADYHNEHFLYIDPVYLKDGKEGLGHWFAMCTCGSPAIILDVNTTKQHESLENVNLLVCYHYMLTKTNYGHGYHVGQDMKKWE
jgi:hypothetical protein